MENNVVGFNIESEAFEPFRIDFNGTMNEALNTMVLKGTEEAIVNARLKIKLERMNKIDGMGTVRDVLVPSVIHNVKYGVKVEGGIVGGLQGEWELVADNNGRYGLRPIDDGQMSIDDFHDAEVENT